VPTRRHELARAAAGAWGGDAGFGGEATGTSRAYLTPKMEEMVELSRESSRKRGSSS
jgi:hypothetical protein